MPTQLKLVIHSLIAIILHLWVSFCNNSMLTIYLMLFPDDGDHMQAAADALLKQMQKLASPPTNARNFMVLDVYGRGIKAPSGEAFKQTVFNGLHEFHTPANLTIPKLNVAYVDFATLWAGVLGQNPGFAAFGYTSTDSCTKCTPENGCSTIGMCDDPEHFFYWIPGLVFHSFRSIFLHIIIFSHPSKETGRIMADFVGEVWKQCQVTWKFCGSWTWLVLLFRSYCYYFT